MSSNNPVLTPVPKELSVREGSFVLPAAGYILLQNNAPSLLVAAQRVQKSARRDWHITASKAGKPEENVVTLACDTKLDTGEQGYLLDVTPQGIVVRAATPAGVFYGACTVCQLLAQYPAEIPCLSISDSPDLAVRGVMLDVSRDKVPTLQTLMDLAELLAGWKINHIELYTEHTFEYRDHPVVWEKASPITGEDVLRLDKFCAERFIELAPNQNSFGHMARWLVHDEYRPLAEAPDGCDTDWGHFKEPFSLCPGDPGSIELLSGLYDELLPHFSSKLLNVGLDETVDLGCGRSKQECDERGVGRVYLDFLKKIHGEVSKRGHRMLFWGDIVVKHPELIADLPEDIIALEWGYEADHPFDADGAKFAEAGIEFWVCPGTSTWNTIAGRTDACLGNLSNAAMNGLKHGATGCLNTDWGDNGHWQYLPVSYLGFMAGGAASWNANSNGFESLPSALNLHAFSDGAGIMGQLAYDLGNAYTKIAKRTFNATLYWQALAYPLSNLGVMDNVSRDEIAQARSVAEKALLDIQKSSVSTPDADLVTAEFTQAARMVMLGCDRADLRFDIREGKDVTERKAALADQLREVIAEHERLWLARNRPGGLVDSRKGLEGKLTD